MMKNFNVMALRGKINDVAQSMALDEFVRSVFYTLCLTKTNILSSLDIFQSLTTEIKNKILLWLSWSNLGDP